LAVTIVYKQLTFCESVGGDLQLAKRPCKGFRNNISEILIAYQKAAVLYNLLTDWCELFSANLNK